MKRVISLTLVLLLLAGCSPTPSTEDGSLHILCTTYPVYLFTTAVTEGAEGVRVDLLVDQQTSCLHDYTLSVKDMRAVDRADVIVVNGAGLEDFLTDALGAKDAPVIDCSNGIPLLPSPDHRHHEDGDDDEHDPHFWMDPGNAARMVDIIAGGLSALDPDRAGTYEGNRTAALSALAALDPSGMDGRPAICRLITFHDGFQYFADAYGFTLLRSIEEEEGAEASAKELKELIELIQADEIPAIFVERNGARRSAEVIAGETGCKVYELDMIMSGSGSGLQPYLDAMEQNYATVLEAMG